MYIICHYTICYYDELKFLRSGSKSGAGRTLVIFISFLSKELNDILLYSKSNREEIDFPDAL